MRTIFEQWEPEKCHTYLITSNSVTTANNFEEFLQPCDDAPEVAVTRFGVIFFKSQLQNLQ